MDKLAIRGGPKLLQITYQAGRARNFLTNLLLPDLDFFLCMGIWWSLSLPAKRGGRIWFAAEVVYATIRTRGFRLEPAKMDLSGSSDQKWIT